MESEAALIKASRMGDQMAYRQLVERYQDFVFTIAQRVLRDRELAEEAAQDAFVKAYQNLYSFKSRSKFSTWLYAITWRTAIDYSRKGGINTTPLDEDENQAIWKDTSPDAGDMLEQQDLKQMLQQVLRQLHPTDASLITLFYLKEKSVAEVAAITDLSRSNVKTRLHRLRAQLRHQLSPALKQYYTS